MHRGYFALWRKVEDHPFYKEPREFSKLEAWIDLLMNTQYRHEPQDVIIGMNTIQCNYGESLKSIKTWSDRWMWSRSKVFRFLKLLKKMDQINFKSETVTTRIKVINFENYDPNRNGCGHEMKHKRNASETRSNTDNKGNKVKKVNNTTNPPSGDYTESFERFWKQYPKKVGKDAAFKKWKQIGKSKNVSTGELIKAIILQVQSNHFLGSNGNEFIPNPLTWLNQGRWKDEIKSLCNQPNGCLDLDPKTRFIDDE